MTKNQEWSKDSSREEEEARGEAYRRLADAARRAGLSGERLAQLMRQLETNEMETRDFLANQVYGVPDELLDDLIRVRLVELEEQ